MFSETNETTTGNPKHPHVWRINAAYFFATPLIMCLSVIRAVFRVEVSVAFASPGAFEREQARHSALVGAGTMVVKYHDDVQIVEAVEPQFEGRDAGYTMPLMHDAFLRAAKAMAQVPDVVDRFNKLGIHSSLIHGDKPEHDNDSRSDA
jgi:hypothetical protein